MTGDAAELGVSDRERARLGKEAWGIASVRSNRTRDVVELQNSRASLNGGSHLFRWLHTTVEVRARTFRQRTQG
jgi:hypothetical protein